METEGYKRIKKVALNYVKANKIGKDVGAYSIMPRGGENFYGSYHALQVLDLFGELHNRPAEEIATWVDYIQSYQEEDGSLLVRQQPFGENPIVPGIDGKLHSTRGLFWSFRVLRSKPKYAPTFIEPLLDPKTLYDWVGAFDWSMSWRISNQILAVYTFMAGLRDWFGYDISEALEKGMYPALEEKLDPETGYFGTAQGAPLWNGLFGTIHIAPIYFAEGWELKHLERNVDSTIECQREDGSYWEGGSNCPDFDGAYMMANLHHLTDYRKEDLEATARKYLQHALMHEDPEGRGWRNRRRDWKRPEGAIEPEFMMLDSWFYPASIGLVAHMLQDTGYEGPYDFSPGSLHMQNAF